MFNLKLILGSKYKLSNAAEDHKEPGPGCDSPQPEGSEACCCGPQKADQHGLKG